MAAPDDLLSETNACNLLARLFRSRGYAIARNIPFREYGVEFHIDGWDAKARVGFEFLTSEDEDHDDLSLEEYKTLMDAQQRGELAMFIIDEVEPLSQADLVYTVNEFLDEVEEAAKAAKAARRRKASASKKTVNKKAAASKLPAPKKAAEKRTAKKKPAAKKAAPKPTKKAATKARKQAKKTAPKGVKKAAAKGGTKGAAKGSKKASTKTAKKRGR